MNTSLIQKTFFTLAAIAAIGVIAPANVKAQEEEAGPNTGKVSFALGVDFVTEYYFRGIAQENQGFIAQPWADVTLELHDNVDLYVGIWNSLHSGPSGEDGALGDPHYELDFYTGVNINDLEGALEKFSFDIGYVAYSSPNDAFTTVQEIGFGIEYDDSELWGDSGYALSPYIHFAFETSAGADAGTEQGVYMEIGFGPSFELTDSADFPLTLSVPVTLGFSLDNYYEDAFGNDEFFGFLDIGLDLSMPLTMIPSDFGAWELTVGVHVMFLGDSTEDIAERDFAVDGDADVEVYGVFGISMSY